MTLYRLFKELEDSALLEPNVRTIVENDIYRINSLADIDYRIFAITQNQHRSNEAFMTYSLNLFIVDRWDETLDNQLNVQSDAIVALKEIIDRFMDKHPDFWFNGTVMYQPFYQRFKDVTAGVYATVEINVPIDQCYSDYEE